MTLYRYLDRAEKVGQSLHFSEQAVTMLVKEETAIEAFGALSDLNTDTYFEADGNTGTQENEAEESDLNRPPRLRSSIFSRSQSSPPPSTTWARSTVQRRTTDERRWRLKGRMAGCESFQSVTVTVGTWPLFGALPDGHVRADAGQAIQVRSASVPLIFTAPDQQPDPAGNAIRADHILAWLGKVGIYSASAYSTESLASRSVG